MTWTRTADANPDANLPILIGWDDRDRIVLSNRDKAGFWRDLESAEGYAFRAPDFWCYVPDHPNKEALANGQAATEADRAEFERLKKLLGK